MCCATVQPLGSICCLALLVCHPRNLYNLSSRWQTLIGWKRGECIHHCRGPGVSGQLPAEPVITTSLLCISASISSLSLLNLFSCRIVHFLHHSLVLSGLVYLQFHYYLPSSIFSFFLYTLGSTRQAWKSVALDGYTLVFFSSVCVYENMNLTPKPALQMFHYFAANGNMSDGFIF